MKPKSYWQKRSGQIAARQHRKADGYEYELQREYERAQRTIQRDIEAFYGRYAKNNDISYAEAQRLLSSGELKEFKMSLEEFIDKAKNNADGRWTKQLNNVYYRTRVSRLEALQVQINQQIEILAGSKQVGVERLLGGAYEDTYYRTMYEIQRGTGIGASFARIDDKALEKVLGTKLDGRNWSQRIWDDRTKLRQELHTKLSQGFIRGDSVDRMSRELADRMRVSYNRARTLVQTETAFFAEQATMSSYEESGILDQYEVLVTLDDRTCPICGPLDGKVFRLSEIDVGVNYPPFHARCRCTTVPYFEDEIDVGERIARSADGDVYYVPGDITYEQWRADYVDSPKPPENAIIHTKEYRTFNAPEQVKEWEKLVTPQWLESLTAQEANSITMYTGPAYRDINRNLRENIGDKRLSELAERISSGIEKFDLKDNLVVFRGMSKNPFGVDAADLPGLRFKEKGFWSTSMLEGKKFNGSVEMEILVPSKSRGAPVNVLSEFKDVEYEFLLDSGLEYRIIEANESNGKLKIVAEVVVDGD
ncbi:phage head morphogenesis protein [Xylanibacillus composti]|uniref:SPP1 gp7 family phage head morphogenesis protein n=1 Tax=Xylanibacillus composti TaxID=1572762 RepID=A0A8J4H1U6_9BACL|nr:minor capsid protein [Xylanibacillus composti]MDT9723780.1 phage head morphogenesis protein [Xylanibacillus composti]GIQ67449.1 hypothetical protein XYCOK13_02730 [Xylanibacillus composti]